ncbi:MAG TPA: hypothetical protein VMU19_05330, partial [Bryobacteraceae bacterium]|nr:hypothetical protein [Bryobacteraceae bacterium]
MKRAAAALLAVCCWTGTPDHGLRGQSAAVAVETEHPRLFLTPAHLRLLKRERERGSDRWHALEAVAGAGVTLPEPGFALALVYQVSGDEAAGRRAVSFALDPANSAPDLRQMALVFDWCQDLLTDSQRAALAQRIAKGLFALAGDQSAPAASARALASIAIYDDYPDAPAAELNRVVRDWWGGRIAPELNAGHDVFSRDDALPLFELLQAVRDATGVDLREACPGYFVNLPIERL